MKNIKKYSLYIRLMSVIFILKILLKLVNAYLWTII